jgi:hypothetical protein
VAGNAGIFPFSGQWSVRVECLAGVARVARGICSVNSGESLANEISQLFTFL